MKLAQYVGEVPDYIYDERMGLFRSSSQLGEHLFPPIPFLQAQRARELAIHDYLTTLRESCRVIPFRLPDRK